ncbi:MAG: response regulator, partial [Candidatus Pacebacteria bacterium]|nr:response regulator [Candidatus Paceibacterota bacterium]
IIMDCEMPVKNGFEATQELLELMAAGEVADVPIIACTAFTDDEQKSLCFESGMKAFLNKPVMIEELTKTLKGFGII